MSKCLGFAELWVRPQAVPRPQTLSGALLYDYRDKINNESVSQPVMETADCSSTRADILVMFVIHWITLMPPKVAFYPTSQ